MFCFLPTEHQWLVLTVSNDAFILKYPLHHNIQIISKKNGSRNRKNNLISAHFLNIYIKIIISSNNQVTITFINLMNQWFILQTKSTIEVMNNFFRPPFVAPPLDGRRPWHLPALPTLRADPADGCGPQKCRSYLKAPDNCFYIHQNTVKTIIVHE